MSKERNLRWVLVLGMGLVLSIVVGLLFLGERASSSPPAGPADLVGPTVSAHQAYPAAAERAAQWQGEARLAGVSSLQRAAGQSPAGDADWAFQFYAPSTGRVALIVVSGGEAQIQRETLSPYVLPTFSRESWTVDSDRALETWWAAGGGTLLARRPDATVVLQLRTPEGAETPIWTVTGLIADTDYTLIVQVDGSTGAVVGG